MRTYPTSTTNKNVPKDSFLIAETSSMSGEIVLTYYSDREGNLFKVYDWKGHKSEPAYMFQVCGLTGDSENIIKSRYESYFGLKG